jgi:hypothetical protein
MEDFLVVCEVCVEFVRVAFDEFSGDFFHFVGSDFAQTVVQPLGLTTIRCSTP